MKVLLAAAQFSPDISGVQRHALNVLRCLHKQSEILEIYFVVARWQRELAREVSLRFIDRVTIVVAEMERNFVSRNLWYYRDLPKLASQLKPDIVHLSYPVPVDASAMACPIVVTLHDLYPYEIPGNFGFPKVLFNRLILQQCLRSVDAIACVSDATMLRMKQYAPQSTWAKALRVYNCVEREQVCTEHSPYWSWRGEPFLLSVSQHRKNKNIPLLIRTFYRLLRNNSIDPQMILVIVGITGPETAGVHRLLSDLQLEDKVVFLQGISEDTLQWCYTRCELLAAPSAAEGFGLPVVEAILAGCRVVCSDIPAFREIDEGSCRFFYLGPDEEENFAQTLLASLQEPRPLPASLPRFSSEVLGVQYVHLYRKLLPLIAHKRVAHQTVAIRPSTPEGRPL